MVYAYIFQKICSSISTQSYNGIKILKNNVLNTFFLKIVLFFKHIFVFVTTVILSIYYYWLTMGSYNIY